MTYEGSHDGWYQAYGEVLCMREDGDDYAKSTESTNEAVKAYHP
jgi:hypothetical protein